MIAEGEYYGMQTFDQALLQHVQAGRVAMEDALAAASSPHDFKLLVAGDGRTATSMDDLARGGRTDEAPAPAPAPASPVREPSPLAASAPSSQPRLGAFQRAPVVAASGLLG